MQPLRYEPASASSSGFPEDSTLQPTSPQSLSDAPEALYIAAISRYAARRSDTLTPLQSATSAFQGLRSYETQLGRRYYRRQAQIPSSPAACGDAGVEEVELADLSDVGKKSSFPFVLKIYRGRESTSLVIEKDWEDGRLFKELLRCYNELRSWRKYLSLRKFSFLTLIWTEPTDISARYGKARPDKGSAKYKRLPHFRVRQYLQYPEEARDSIEFVQWITLDVKHGILFEERWSPYRVLPLVLVPITASLLVALLRVHLDLISDDALTASNACIALYSTALAATVLLNWLQYI
ncbi:hypothetical protein OE88DRAFT_1733524 [Heliocybe sulcata]|uniref:Uncharacterized protein n=1 Tax=Heliocybe sulcata TaxID=5364 RepID=A0A5C3N8R7_9AGAM|nr:hypothetical protein OE88DRAFT_1733524 [Heliocybe sulcata]